MNHCKNYLEKFKHGHENMKVDKQRFYVSLDELFFGASPDGIIHCDYHAS